MQQGLVSKHPLQQRAGNTYLWRAASPEPASGSEEGGHDSAWQSFRRRPEGEGEEEAAEVALAATALQHMPQRTPGQQGPQRRHAEEEGEEDGPEGEQWALAPSLPAAPSLPCELMPAAALLVQLGMHPWGLLGPPMQH